MIGFCSEKNHNFILCHSHGQLTVNKRGMGKAPKKLLMDTFVPNKKDMGQAVAHYGKRNIPPIVHFIFGLSPTSKFGLPEYLAITSAYYRIKPEIIYFHCYLCPTGFLWDMLLPLLTVKRVEPVREIFGNKVSHYAHQADIIRLRSLLKYGGIYLDIDVITIRSFDRLRNYDFVMGQEGKGGSVLKSDGPQLLKTSAFRSDADGRERRRKASRRNDFHLEKERRTQRVQRFEESCDSGVRACQETPVCG
jgi:hypothetical protein